MATNNKLSESVTKLLECSICFEQMSIPKVLPCQHTFCLNCLKRTADSAQTPSPDLILNNSVTIISFKNICCAICRKKHKVPNEGVKGFPNNLTLMTLIDSMKYSANKKRKKANVPKNSPKKQRIEYVLDFFCLYIFFIYLFVILFMFTEITLKQLQLVQSFL